MDSDATVVTLVTADWVVPSAHERPIERGAVRVSGPAIADVGAESELRQRFPDDDIVDGSGSILLPGFVNAHNHMYGTLAHGIPMNSAPSGFWAFLEDYWWPKVENRLDHDMVAAATDWVCAEMLRTGTTTFYDILEGPNAVPGALLVESEIVESRGIRGVLSFEACERIDGANGQLGLEENRNLIEATAKTDLVSGLMCIHTTFTCSPDFIKHAHDLALELDVLLHAHVNEGVHEPQWCETNHGKRTFEHYHDLGVAGQRFLASQCVQMSDRELEIVAETGVRVTHMPLSNCEVGGGIAPIPEMLADGVTAGLGTDGYVNDMFEVMRGAFLLHKARLQDPGAMPAHDVLHMATAGGAAALGFGDVGKLAEGFSADLQLIDASFPTPLAEHNIVDQVVMWRNGSHVKDVMVAGNWRVRSGEVLGADVEQLRDRTQAQAKRLWAMS